MSRKFRFFIWIALLALGFLAGVSWTNRVPEAENEMAETDTTIDEEAVSTLLHQRTITPSHGLTTQELANIQLFENAAPSVCFITTSNVRTDYFTRNSTEIPRGSGSGFVWDDKGHIITNYHVIQGADRATVTLSDRSTWLATLVGKAPEKILPFYV